MSKKRLRVHLVRFLGTMSVLGIFGAIVLPSFLKQVSSCPTMELTPQDTLLSQVPLTVGRFLNRRLCQEEVESADGEARFLIDYMMGAQQTYYLENSAFASMEKLGLGIPMQTDNYTYTIGAIRTKDVHGQDVVVQAISRKAYLHGYAGFMQSTPLGFGIEPAILGVICRTIEPGIGAVPKTFLDVQAPYYPDCGSGSRGLFPRGMYDFSH